MLVRALPRPRHRARRRQPAWRRSWPSCSARTPASPTVAAARCTCSTSSAASTAAGASSAPTCRSPPGCAGARLHANSRSAVLCQFGDGAVATGAFHEALNLASLCGSCRSSSRRSTTSTAWAPRSTSRTPSPSSVQARRRRTGCTASGSTATTSLAVREAADRLLRAGPRRSAGRRCSRPSPTATAATRSPTPARSTAPPRRCSRGASAIRSPATACSLRRARDRDATPTSTRSGRTSRPR